MTSVAPEERAKADALFRSGMQHHQSGRIMAAERDYRAAVAACPGHAAAENLALLLFSQVRGKEAAEVLLGHFHDAFGPVAGDPDLPREMAAADATAARVADGLRRHGAVLLRQCYAVPTLAALAPKFRLRPDNWGKPIFRLGEMDQAEVEAALVTPLLRDLVPALGLDIASWSQGSWVRAAIPKMAVTKVPFHQDMLVCARKCMNVWIALDPCGPGTRAPGLELVARHLPALLPTSRGDDNEYAIQHLEIPEEVVQAQIPADALWQPRFGVGDALLFLGTTVHRTAAAPGLDQLRTSIELRFFETR